MRRTILAYAARLGRKQAQATENRIQKALKPLLEALTDPEESCRRAAVEHVLSTCIPAVIRRLIDRLVELLINDKESVRRRAADSLVQFGTRALPALTHTIRHLRSAVQQARLLEVLRKIGQRVPSDQRKKQTAPPSPVAALLTH
jgi:HEAT repeat protein